MKRTHSVTIALTSAALILTAAMAGPLTPPAGPVASSYKTLSDVEPRIAINATNTPGDSTSLFRITGPGAYYLAGNVAGEAGKAIITIANPTQVGVDIDLRGFKLAGGASAVVCSLNQESVRVHDGFITGATSTGINLSNVDRARVEGISIYGAATGIAAARSATIQNCSVTAVTTGILVSDNSIVKDCSVEDASLNGVQCDSGCVISNCASRACTGDGFRIVGSNSTLSHCTAFQCGAHGVETGLNNVVENCTVGYANGSGYLLGPQCTIRDCSADNCTAQGIVVQGGGTVLNNQCKANGAGSAAGIWIQGTNSHVEGNNVVANGYGIYVSGLFNLIVRNRASTNSQANYYIGATNEFGPLVNAGVNSVVVSGSSAAGTLGSTDPNANFSY